MAVMSYEAFIATVERGAHIASDEAERAACATLQTLAEDISTSETVQIAGRLPERLHRCVSPSDGAETFDAGEFLRRVARRAQLDEPAARRDARAVFSALFRSIGPEEFHALRSALPPDFAALLDDALRDASTLVTGDTEARPGLSTGEFIERVADRLDVDGDRAARASEAVLEVLAIRISGGEVEDLARRLPPELRAPLQRGRAEGGRPAMRLSADAFLREIAQRADTTADEAADQVRAVFTTLREAAGDREFHETTRQLPDEYAPLLRYQG
jgi:uncharacterized protein (DUF2267 family)